MGDLYKMTLAAAAVAAAEAHRNVRRTAAGGGQASLVQFSFFEFATRKSKLSK